MDANGRKSETPTGLSLQEILERTTDNVDITDLARRQGTGIFFLFSEHP